MLFRSDIVPEEQLTRVNGINGTIQSAFMLVSPMISGALMTAAPIQVFFFIDAATAALAIVVLLLFLRVKQRNAADADAAASGIDYFADLRQGFGYIAGHPFLKSFFGFTVLFCFAAAPAAFLTPLQVARAYGEEVWRLTAVEVTFSVGMLLGGIAISAWGGFKRNRLYTMVAASALLGISTLALGFPGPFWIYLAFMTIIGVSLPFFNTPAAVLLQERIEPGYLGRVFSVLIMINSSMMPVAILIFGPLADIAPIEWQLIGTGAVMLAMAPAMFKSAPLLEAGRF